MKELTLLGLWLATAVVSYIYLDWGVLQIIGVTFVVLFVNVADEKGPVWRRTLWSLFALVLMVLAHFIMTDDIVYWIELIGSTLLFLISVGLVLELMNSKPGDGSVLTVYVLGLIICVPIAGLLLYKGLSGLGYM